LLAAASPVHVLVSCAVIPGTPLLTSCSGLLASRDQSRSLRCG